MTSSAIAALIGIVSYSLNLLQKYGNPENIPDINVIKKRFETYQKRQKFSDQSISSDNPDSNLITEIKLKIKSLVGITDGD